MAILAENLINGQKPEFGNPEHIQFIKDQQAKAEELKNRVVIKTDSNVTNIVKYGLSIHWNCHECNCQNLSCFESDWDDFTDESTQCHRCKAYYEVIEGNDLMYVP